MRRWTVRSLGLAAVLAAAAVGCRTAEPDMDAPMRRPVQYTETIAPPMAGRVIYSQPGEVVYPHTIVEAPAVANGMNFPGVAGVSETLNVAPQGASQESVSAKPATYEPEPAADASPRRRSFADITADPRFAHAADYGWLVGRLQYSHARKQWKLRYASVDEEDRHGGSVTLVGADRQLADLRDGTVVRVTGSVMDAGKGSPDYRVGDVQRLP